MDLSRFGTDEFPLRPSRLRDLVVCPWRAVMETMQLVQDRSGVAADTGSALHKAVAGWHKLGRDAKAALEYMRDNLKEYPFADLGDAGAMFQYYVADPRNLEAELVLVEEPVSVALAPDEWDPTQKPIVIEGTVDQVRRVNGVLRAYDLKTGRPSGWDMIHDHSAQLAAYCLAASQRLGQDVEPGAFIRVRGYGPKSKPSPDGVFFELPWALSDTGAILGGLKVLVAAIRAGKVWLGPTSAGCRWCPAMGLDGCIPRFNVNA